MLALGVLLPLAGLRANQTLVELEHHEAPLQLDQYHLQLLPHSCTDSDYPRHDKAIHVYHWIENGRFPATGSDPKSYSHDLHPFPVHVLEHDVPVFAAAMVLRSALVVAVLPVEPYPEQAVTRYFDPSAGTASSDPYFVHS